MSQASQRVELSAAQRELLLEIGAQMQRSR